ncbi:Dpy-30 motif protein [Toxoplasma gondii RUB]|uniref:Dpy-30 motif protein n=11 Tax=Toxoplasma gondii TaxID=5811 RepID=S7WEW0_TOXGG|nr:Dpy-30 motif protein [Toxoplasma gondii GT1]KAF4641339.1 Dpy-30 motif protein [Toxoplasma gondii]KFG29381.1 Dpy-30 motif protein [Toxoplasma gondii p89]KFG33804.1 Dpy-30 motif protein [Toxoplasma gondii GAB2-2007-GAL-DOM2]KFG38000.1 Dpy-30 motif protein [Toxoplasma gondii FOU]KFG65116.1 Dpy-30 motif protein [Toxoplasma gondii RUB]KFH00677.1 Dpy-30 motif protein [Toxoplasma gondii VAND]KFH13270.1 Dpy-30 motif protein [Toxoplasma gondii MAS]PIM05107.1 Dpy-30 motif protein [Toxoplasma gondi
MEESMGLVNDCDNEDQHDSTAAPGERQVAQSLDTILEQHKTIQQETNAYLQNTVGRPLSLAIASLVKTQPLDAIGYLVQWLRHYVAHEQQKTFQIKERKVLSLNG